MQQGFEPRPLGLFTHSPLCVRALRTLPFAALGGLWHSRPGGLGDCEFELLVGSGGAAPCLLGRGWRFVITSHRVGSEGDEGVRAACDVQV